MSPSFYVKPEISFNGKRDLILCYSMPYFSALENYDFPWSNLDETRDCKRLKQEPNSDESIQDCASLTLLRQHKFGASCTGFYKFGNDSSSGSLSSWPRLRFRDYVWAYTERYLAIVAMEEAAAAFLGCEKEEIEEENAGDGTKLVKQLVTCAEAVACRDKSRASALLSELRANAIFFGTSFQRVASCFVQGLSDRLMLVQPLGTVGVPMIPTAKSITTFLAEKDEALRLAYEICPQIQFGHFVANATILEALKGESSIHIVDLGMSLGLPDGQQWRPLIHSLANQTRQPPPRLRITGVGHPIKRLQTIGHELTRYAGSLGYKNFEYSHVETSLENLKANDFHAQEGEAIVINSILHLHSAVKESRGALNSVLQTLRELSPKLFVLMEQDSSHNGPFFLGRFMEALNYYSAIFDALDTMLPKYDTRRAKIEQFFYAEEIKNIVSCEGGGRVERHERADQWRRRMSRAGFHPSPIKMILQAKQWLGKVKACEGYTVGEEKGCLLLGWKSRAIVAVSCWKCSS